MLLLLAIAGSGGYPAEWTKTATSMVVDLADVALPMLRLVSFDFAHRQSHTSQPLHNDSQHRAGGAGTSARRIC